MQAYCYNILNSVKCSVNFYHQAIIKNYCDNQESLELRIRKYSAVNTTVVANTKSNNLNMSIMGVKNVITFNAKTSGHS